MTEDQRSPGQDVIDVVVPVKVKNARSFAARDERRRAADTAKGPHRRVYAARNQFLGSREHFLRSGSIHSLKIIISQRGAGNPARSRLSRRLVRVEAPAAARIGCPSIRSCAESAFEKRDSSARPAKCRSDS